MISCPALNSDSIMLISLEQLLIYLLALMTLNIFGLFLCSYKIIFSFVEGLFLTTVSSNESSLLTGLSLLSLRSPAVSSILLLFLLEAYLSFSWRSIYECEAIMLGFELLNTFFDLEVLFGFALDLLLFSK